MASFEEIKTGKSNESNRAVVGFTATDKDSHSGSNGNQIMIRRAAEKALDDNYSLTIKIDTMQKKFKKMKELCDKLTNQNRSLEEKNWKLSMENM